MAMRDAAGLHAVHEQQQSGAVLLRYAPSDAREVERTDMCHNM